MHTIQKIFESNLIKTKKQTYTIESYANECLMEWKNRYRCINVEDMKKRLKINEILNDESPCINDLLVYIEYIVNLKYLCLFHSKMRYGFTFVNIEYLSENINDVLDHLNYEIQYYADKEMALIVEKNPAATAAAELVNDEMSFKIIEYNHYLMKSDLSSKKEILNAISNIYEPLRDNLKANGYKSLESDASFLLNNLNIRHNNLDGQHFKQYTAELSSEQLEQWYDKTYDVLLLCILTDNYIDLKNEIKELKLNFQNMD